MAKVNLDVTDRLDVTCRQGDTFELTLTLKDSDGEGLNLDSDDYSFLMQVRSNAQSSRAQRLRRVGATHAGGGGGEADEPNILIVDGGIANVQDVIIGSAELGKKGGVNFTFNNVDDDGNVTIFLSASDMAKVPPGRYKYDFQYKVGDTQRTVVEGVFKVNSDISKSL